MCVGPFGHPASRCLVKVPLVVRVEISSETGRMLKAGQEPGPVVNVFPSSIEAEPGGGGV